MKKITIADLDRWEICRSVVLDDKKSLSPIEVLDLPIPEVERIRAVLREEILGEEKYIQVGHTFARRAVKKHCLKCGIPMVMAWARDYLTGKDIPKGSLIAAYEARVVAEAAWAAEAAWSAEAAWAAEAAWSAWAGNAANWACAAERAAGNGVDAERKAQVKILKKILKEEV